MWVLCFTVRGSAKKIQLFWTDKVNLVSHISLIGIYLEVKPCILGIYPDYFAPGHKAVHLNNMSLLPARRGIMLRWKSMDGLTPAVQLQEMAPILALEKLTYK